MKFNSTRTYIYRCNDCNGQLLCFEDERLEKEQRPTPFSTTCPYCNGQMYDKGYYDMKETLYIKEFDKNNKYNEAIFVLLDEDILNYGDMACGCLCVRKGDKLIATWDVYEGSDK